MIESLYAEMLSRGEKTQLTLTMSYINFTLKSVTVTYESTFSSELLGDANGSGRLGNLVAPSAQLQLTLKLFISI